ncbi:exodeoxyribonuclease V subunit beta [Pseudoalteromonas sp. MMG005]|uniref:exodeoxyribonuclease V subunit beta n=1 Tax=Pseudoalteromonas sp. MMG005 TaxID=2822682 RepID=UPI001B3A1353|nr:exodeoxyribonuclease V subunit beta [Pseudoalteromonas sp. MMG005]MBQ4845952.1 exodeoxyribonuclease V subunit beta [Pseudoalteromonas sp. MMG005]
MKILNPQTMPLFGQSLIEASAGTGKTYTITGLYLRCLLGLQTEHTQMALSVDQILVVTFTEAATQEIKERVRNRIITARDALLGAPCEDELITAILAQVSDQHAAFALLDAAAKSMDEAAIFTIHGFCQRMLKQHAFESKVAFNLEFILDESELIIEAVKDYWRGFVYPLDKDTTSAVLEHFSSPHALVSKVMKILNKGSASVTPEFDLQAVLNCRKDYQSRAVSFKKKLLTSDFFSVLTGSDLAKNKAPGRAANINALRDYCDNESWYFEFGTAKHSFNLWAEETLQDSQYYKKNGQLINHSMLTEFSRMARLHTQLSQGLPLAILQHASKAVKELLRAHKLKHGLITPDDLLSNLYDALLAEQGDILRTKIATLYPVSMIDEFQDTDPTQYGIFNRIYQDQDNTTLTMIGDPKQAIYGFRGADIFTYMAAKERISEQAKYTLSTNYRSAQGVVTAINGIFSAHEHSFIFNQSIPFVKVAAKGKSESNRLMVLGKAHNALTFSVLKDDSATTSKAVALKSLSSIFAKKITLLLTQAAQGEANIGDVAVKASDICILVRDRAEASIIKSALQHHAIASVYLARDSIFKQPIALALLQFLTVLHGSYDEAALRGVLASPLFSLHHQEIYELREQETAWQCYLDQFAQLQRIWHKQGAMAMLEQLLMDNQLPRLWKSNDYLVERWLTDYRHLSELLQQKQIELDGTLRVLRWFSAQCSDAQQDAAQVRLESDADLVKIVTMHASKGLEYPIVYMPFATTYREASDVVYHDNQKLVYSVLPDDEQRALAEKERLAEDIRLLYVAVTRAIHHCDIGLFNIAAGRTKKPGINHTGLGFVLFGTQPFVNAQQWHEQLVQFCTAHPDMACDFIDDTEDIEKIGVQVEQHNALHVKNVKTKIDRQWRATSFSQLSYQAHNDERPLGALDENHQLDLPEQHSMIEASAYSFPKGAKPGSCLHEIFELIDFTQPESPSNSAQISLSDAVEQSLLKYRIDEQWQKTTEQWISACLECTLNEETNLNLAALTPADCLVEMEFYLPLAPLNAPMLNKLLLEITGQSSHLQFEQVKGLLKGFIDLIFIHNGQYFILDYKSNYLGDSALDYQKDNLRSAMDAHQYHLQYLIYSVALHRLLQQRLPDYDPNVHLGGVYYLFLRALPDASGVFFNKLTIPQLMSLDALFSEGTL